MAKYRFTILMTVMILVAMVWPKSSLPDTGFPATDKIVHFLLFTCWTAALVNEARVTKWWFAVGFGLLMGLCSEMVQIPIEGRTFDWNDLLADGAGVLFGNVNADLFSRLAKKVFRRS